MKDPNSNEDDLQNTSSRPDQQEQSANQLEPIVSESSLTKNIKLIHSVTPPTVTETASSRPVPISNPNLNSQTEFLRSPPVGSKTRKVLARKESHPLSPTPDTNFLNSMLETEINEHLPLERPPKSESRDSVESPPTTNEPLVIDESEPNYSPLSPLESLLVLRRRGYSDCGHRDKTVQNLIFNYLELYELLRLRRTSKFLGAVISQHFVEQPFLDLSPYFGWIRDENILIETKFNKPKNQNFFQVFQKLYPKRTKLSLAYSTGLTCNALRHFLDGDGWRENLLGLNIYYCNKVKPRKSEMNLLGDTITEHASFLTDLNLSKINSLPFSILFHILKHLKYLQRIQLHSCLKIDSSITNEELEFLTLTEELLITEKSLFLDCRNCITLTNRPFWQTLSKEDEQNFKYFGLKARGNTWILGPENISLEAIIQILCLNCNHGNSKTQIVCEKCGKFLSLIDFIKDPRKLCRLETPFHVKTSRKNSTLI